MSAGSGACIGRKAETVEDRSKCQHSHEQYRDVKVTELTRSGRVAMRMRDQAQGDGADGDSHSHAELHDRAKEAIRPAHPAGWDVRVGERSHTGELQRPAGSMKKQDGDHEPDWRRRTESRAKSNRCSCNDSVHNEDAAESETTKDLNANVFMLRSDLHRRARAGKRLTERHLSQMRSGT
jgi:hypothetical protein